MAIKYLAGNRLWGTDAERLALTTVTQDYASAISTYTPDYFLKLDEGTGTSLTNAGSSSDIASLSSTTNPSWVGGYNPSGYSLKFTQASGRTDDRIHTTDSGGSTGLPTNDTQAWSLMMLVKLTGLGGQANIWEWANGGQGMSTFNINSDGKMYLWWYDTTGHEEIANTNVVDGEWHTLGLTHASGGGIVWYLDGVSDGTGTEGETYTDTNYSDTINLHGGSVGSGTMIFDSFFFKESVVTAPDMSGLSTKMKGTFTYPSLPNGATFLTSDTNKLYMWNGTDTWNEVG